jgi:hypothetical protein
LKIIGVCRAGISTSPELGGFRAGCPRYRRRVQGRQIEVGDRFVTAIAPCPEDLIVSKLARLDEKDKQFIEAYNSLRPLNADIIEERIRSTNLESAIADRAVTYVRKLTGRME